MPEKKPDLAAIDEFLGCQTPGAWIDNALENQDLLLIDHANCEKKAASTALQLTYRYVDNYQLLQKMSRLAREELRHFEQVLKILRDRKIDYIQLSASRYAGQLHKSARKSDPGKLIDTLLIGAFIEARSCERFARLAPHLDAELGRFYNDLLASEARHFRDYLGLAESVANGSDLDSRKQYFAELEMSLIQSEDAEFRFHSGPVYSNPGKT